MYCDITSIPKEFSGDYELEQCFCGTKYRIPYFKCDENEGRFEFLCPICHTLIQMIRQEVGCYKISKHYPNKE